MLIEKSRKLAEQINAYRPPKDRLAIWWLGQSGFVVRSQRYSFVFDPYLSTTLEDATKEMVPEILHIRMTPIPVLPEELTGVDYIICSHDHGDHYDAASVKGLLQGSPAAKIIVPPAAVPSLIRDGIERERIIPVGEGDRYCQEDMEVTAIRAKHNQFDESPEYGFPYVGYFVKTEGRTLYHGGDTILFDELPQLLKERKIDVGFMAINGYDDVRIKAGFQSNCTYQEAAELAKQAGVKLMIPCHYDMFTANTEQVGKFVNYMNSHPDMPAYLVPVIGQPFTV